MSEDWLKPVIDYARCKKCGRCVRACPNHAVTMGPDGPIIQCSEEDARRCTYASEGFLCLGEEGCPNNAISWEFEIVFEDEEQTGA